MKRRFFLIMVLVAALCVFSACHTDADPWQPLPDSATAAPTATPTEEELAAEEVQEADPEPTPGGDSEPGLNG